MDGFQIATAEFNRLKETFHDVDKWSLSINTRLKGPAGRCHYDKFTIELAPWLIKRANEAAIIETVRHEVAHIIAGRAAAHGPNWKTACRATGADGRRCYDKALVALNDQREYRWEAICANCNKVVAKRRNRTKRTYTHTGCGGRISWQSIRAQLIIDKMSPIR